MPIRVCLLELMRIANLTQEELAARSGVSRTTVGAFCRNRRQYISFRTLERLCIALDVLPGELLHWPDRPVRSVSSAHPDSPALRRDGQRSGHS